MADAKYLKTVIAVSIHLAGENPIYGESATRVAVNDDAAGPFIVLSQSSDRLVLGELTFNVEELEAVTAAARR